MHKQWLDLIPYYVAGTVPRSKAAAFEQHLARCPECRQALDEWRTVAGIVRPEAQSWANQTPALSAAVRAQLHTVLGPSSNGRSHPVPAVNQTQTIHYIPQRARTDLRRVALPVTMVAALLVTAFVGVLLLFLSRGGNKPDTLSHATDVTPLSARTATPLPAGTRPTGTPFQGSVAVTPTLTPRQDLGILSSPRPSATHEQALYGAPTPPAGVCSVHSTNNSPVPIYGGPGFGYAVISTLGASEYRSTWVKTGDVWYEIFDQGLSQVGWVYGGDVKLYGPCGGLPEPSPTSPSYAYATPTAAFGDQIGMGYIMITLQQVAGIPANTRVRISQAWYDGEQWWYHIVSQDGQLEADAAADQLGFAPDYTPGPTPTSQFGTSIGTGYVMITLEQVGAIPAGTRVGIGSAWFDGQKWIYQIMTMDNQTSANATDGQLAYISGYTPGPTPTAKFMDTMIYSNYPLVTLEQVGPIPAGTYVRIASAMFDGVEWTYGIIAVGEQLNATAYERQLGYALPQTPTPTPTPSGAMSINSFSADPVPFVAGQSLTLTWNVSGAASVRLLDYNLTAPPYSTIIQSGLPPVGSLTITVPLPDSYAYTDSKAYQLIATNTTGQELAGSSDNGGLLTSALPCPFHYFFGDAPGSCPELPMPLSASAIYQTFEGGFMVSFSQTGYYPVYVLYGDGTWQAFMTSGTRPQTSDTPPDGRYAPDGALWEVWSGQAGVHDKLGWATAPAQSYTVLIQNEARQYLTSKTSINFYLSLADGRSLYMYSLSFNMDNGTWQTM